MLCPVPRDSVAAPTTAHPDLSAAHCSLFLPWVCRGAIRSSGLGLLLKHPVPSANCLGEHTEKVPGSNPEMLQVFSGQHPLMCWSLPVSLRVFVSRREIIPACQVWALKESMSSHCCVLGINGKTTSEGALAWWLWWSAVFSWAGGDSSRKKWARHAYSCSLSPPFQTTAWIVRHLTWHCSLLLWCEILNLTWNVKWDALFFSFHSNSLLIWMLTFLVCQAPGRVSSANSHL